MLRRLIACCTGLAIVSGALVEVLARRVTRIRRRRPYRHTVLAVEADALVFVRDAETVRPGSYGIDWPRAHGVVGEVLALEGDRVSRRLVGVERGEASTGKVAFGHLHEGDPARALGLEFREQLVETEIGQLPVWELRGASDKGVLLLHGYGGARESALSFIPMLRALGLSVYVPSYRNDPDAPATRDRRYHLGSAEWREVEATIALARANGCSQVALFGWSMGAAIALQAYDRLRADGSVAALVLDSPVLDWRGVFKYQAMRRHVPAPLAALTLLRVAQQAAIDYGRFDWVARSGELDLRVLIVHSSGDPVVPVTASAALARARPDLVEFVDIEVAGHVGTWNVDPSAYEARVQEFLRENLSLGVSLAS